MCVAVARCLSGKRAERVGAAFTSVGRCEISGSHAYVPGNGSSVKSRNPFMHLKVEHESVAGSHDIAFIPKTLMFLKVVMRLKGRGAVSVCLSSEPGFPAPHRFDRCL